MSDLFVCPVELKALDPNAEVLWPVFLKKTGISMSVRRDRVIDNQSRHAWIIRNLGIPSLQHRLSIARNELARAKVWWRESAACSEGTSIPDLTADTMYLLNPFIVTPSLKFADPWKRAVRKADEPWIVGECSRCGGPIKDAPFLSATKVGEFCSRECRDAAKAVVLPFCQPGQPSIVAEVA